MKNKKALALILICVLCVSMLSLLFAGCAAEITDAQQIADEWAKAGEYLENSAKETNYRAKSAYIFDNKVVNENGAIITDMQTVSQVEFLINYKGDDPATDNVNETAVLLQRSETSLAKTTYKKAYYGASLASGQNAKDSTFDDYKLYQYVTQSDITVKYAKNLKKNQWDEKTVTPVLRTQLQGTVDEQIAQFMREQLPALSPSNSGDSRLPAEKHPGTEGKSREELAQIVQNLIDSQVMPVKVTKMGVVTTFYFQLDEAHKNLALNGGKKTVKVKDDAGNEIVKYPVIVRFTQGRLDKITDDNDAPTVKYFMTYMPSNFDIQNYDALYTQYYDESGNLQTYLGENESIVG